MKVPPDIEAVAAAAPVSSAPYPAQPQWVAPFSLAVAAVTPLAAEHCSAPPRGPAEPGCTGYTVPRPVNSVLSRHLFCEFTTKPFKAWSSVYSPPLAYNWYEKDSNIIMEISNDLKRISTTKFKTIDQ